jgi:uncharacterized protein YukJ
MKNYSLLKGRPIHNRLGSSKSPHYQVQVSANGEMFRIAINVKSQDGSEVEFAVKAPFVHPLTDSIKEKEEGCYSVAQEPGGIALDYIRGNLIQPQDFQALPVSASGPDNDLNEKLDAYVQRAMSDESAMIYAFGEAWGPENNKADQYFGFKPGRGIHDIHFNQGNPPGGFAQDNGNWHDGGVIFEFPNEKQWVAIFLKFQTQAWHSTEADSGHAGGAVIVPAGGTAPVTAGDIDGMPSSDMPDGLVRIAAAYVNDVKTPERETVTLLNTADYDIDLAGWVIKDKQKNAMPLSGTIGAGETLRVEIQPPLALSNKGGLISLINADGLKVHGVAYTAAQAKQPGRTIAFC